MVAIGGFVLSSMNAGSFTQGQSSTLNDARTVMQQIEKEARGANQIDWCAPIGSCLEIDAQSPTGSFKQVRYVHTGTDLERQEFDTVAGEWSDALTVIERVVNAAEDPVFSDSSCDAQSITLQRVIIDLRIEPTPQSDPVLRLETSFRPRNFPSVSVCEA